MFVFLVVAQLFSTLHLNPPLRYGVNPLYHLASSIDALFCSTVYLSINTAYIIPNNDVKG